MTTGSKIIETLVFWCSTVDGAVQSFARSARARLGSRASSSHKRAASFDCVTNLRAATLRQVQIPIMTFSRCVVLALTWAASASAAIPTVNLTCDVHGRDVLMPLVGAGSWQYNDTTAYDSICKAFAAGYTFLDTAWGYGNEVR